MTARVSSIPLIDATEESVGNWVRLRAAPFTAVAVVTGNEAQGAAVTIEGSADGVTRVPLVELTPFGSAADGAGAHAEYVIAPWLFVRARVTSLTGTRIRAFVTLQDREGD